MGGTRFDSTAATCDRPMQVGVGAGDRRNIKRKGRRLLRPSRRDERCRLPAAAAPVAAAAAHVRATTAAHARAAAAETAAAACVAAALLPTRSARLALLARRAAHLALLPGGPVHLAVELAGSASLPRLPLLQALRKQLLPALRAPFELAAGIAEELRDFLLPALLGILCVLLVGLASLQRVIHNADQVVSRVGCLSDHALLRAAARRSARSAHRARRSRLCRCHVRNSFRNAR